MDGVVVISIVAVICSLIGIGVLGALFYLSKDVQINGRKTIRQVGTPSISKITNPPHLVIDAYDSPVAVVTITHQEPPSLAAKPKQEDLAFKPTSNISSPRSIPLDWFQKDNEQREQSPTFSEILRQNIASHSSRRSEAK